MKNLKIKNIIGSIIAYISILFLSIAMNLPFLTAIGLIIAPACIIYFNKNYRVQTKKYYTSLILIMIITLLIAAISTNKNDNKKISTENTKQITTATKNNNSSKEDISQEDVNKENTNKEDTEKTQTATNESTSYNKEDILAGYKLIEVDGGNLSGHREPNVVVNIGFGNREYWAYTNKFGQLVRVEAKEIILQDDSKEPVTSNGRYYSDQADVPGVERSDLDKGHVIADSLGGVSNSYNITPQNSTLNRYGDQAYMEKAIRDAGGCTDFVAIITYPNTTTQIPSHYSYTYTLKGNVIKDEFDNINPDGNSSNNNYSNDNSTNDSSVNDKPNDNNYNGDYDDSPNDDYIGNTDDNTDNAIDNNNTTNNDSEIVYWTINGSCYHSSESCPALSRSKNIMCGTIKDSGKSKPCSKCN